MAVPKKKTSKSKRRLRRSNYNKSVPHINLAMDKETGEYHVPHRMTLGKVYKGKEVKVRQPVEKKPEESANNQ